MIKILKEFLQKKKDSNSNYDVLEINSNKTIQKSTSNCNNGPNKPINFNKIFERTSNDVMSSYVSISNLIDNLEGVMLFTFGYSGVGKSFTLFGGNGKLGLLQSIVNSIKGINEIDVKIYEMYGLGFYNKNYWEDGNKVYNKYIGYTWNKNKIDEGYVLDEFNALNDSQYTLKLKNNNGDDNISEFFLELGEITEQIENKRRTGFTIPNSDDVIKTIKPTLNNPDSSRSILVYEFYIYKDLGENNKVKVPFVVIDLPGKELIINSYGDIGEQSLTENLTGYEIKITPEDADKLIKKMSINKLQQTTDDINDTTLGGEININIGSDSGNSTSKEGGYLKEIYQRNIEEPNKIIFSSTMKANERDHQQKIWKLIKL